MLMATTLALGGCAMVRVVYNQAPDALYWWMDGYFDFKEAQTLRLRTDLDAFHAWHRATELPAYVALLDKARNLAGAEVNSSQVCGLFEEGRVRAIAAMERMEPTIVAIAPTLTLEQIGHLEDKLDKRNRKWRAEWMEGPLHKRVAKRVKESVSRAENVYGNLDEKQLAVIRNAVAQSRYDPQLAYRESLRREQDALATLRSFHSTPATPAQVRTAIRAFLDRSITSPDLAYRNYLDGVTKDGCSAVAALHNSTTQAQRQKAWKTLTSYEDDFRALISIR
ncbi:hypothetical protein BH11PSE7_BH11PSE7_30320 [soil metagenome]